MRRDLRDREGEEEETGLKNELRNVVHKYQLSTMNVIMYYKHVPIKNDKLKKCY